MGSLTGSLTYGEVAYWCSLMGSLLVGRKWHTAHLRAQRAYGLTYGLTYMLGFWVWMHVVGRKWHTGVSWRGAHMMGALMGSLTG